MVKLAQCPLVIVVAIAATARVANGFIDQVLERAL